MRTGVGEAEAEGGGAEGGGLAAKVEKIDTVKSIKKIPIFMISRSYLEASAFARS